MTNLTVKDMKKALENLDDDMVICGKGHFGETLQIDIEGVSSVIQDGNGKSWRDNHSIEALVLNCQEAGPDPD